MPPLLFGGVGAGKRTSQTARKTAPVGRAPKRSSSSTAKEGILEKSRAAVQVVDRSRLRVYQAWQNQPNDNRSLFPPPLLIPPVELDSYLQNARDQQRQRGANSRIGRHWQTLINVLNAPRNRGTAVHASYLDIATLEDCYDLYDKSVIFVLISKAKSFGVKKIADVYLQPLMYRRKSANGADARTKTILL